jgi:hypothetical protein
MLTNKYEMAICDIGASMGVMPRDVFKKICLPELKPMAMCLELGDNSILYLVGITEDAPVKVGEIKLDIYIERSAL